MGKNKTDCASIAEIGSTDHLNGSCPSLGAQAPEAMGGLIRDTFRAMIKSVEQEFDESEFQLPEWLTLKLIGSGRIKCVGDVSRELGTESGGSTRLVDRLEMRGLLRRQRSQTDRRMVGIILTEDGHKMLHSVQPRLAEFWRQKLSVFTDMETAQLFSLLSRMRMELNSGGPSPDKIDLAISCGSQITSSRH